MISCGLTGAVMLFRRWFARQSGFLAGIGLLLGVLFLNPTLLPAQTVRPQPGNASSAPPANIAPQQNSITTFADGIRVLGHERSAAEAYAILLDTHGKKDITRYVEGIRLYAEAKADFDGLVEQLKFDLNEGRDPKSSPQFGQVLEAAASKRIAFTDFVARNILTDVQGARPGLPGVIAAVPDLVKALIDAGFTIWKDFRAGDKQRRDDIRNQLDGLKWRSFADLVKT
jgi:hypothetical protein